MNRNYLAIAILACASTAAMAESSTRGDTTGTVTVAEALSLPDDSKVTVEGRIVRSLGDEEYEFQDDTGTIRVEIDDDDWDGRFDQRLVLTGEIDRDGDDDVELEVDRVAPASG